MFILRPSRPDDCQRALDIWAAAVDATHDFLTSPDRKAIGNEVADFLPQAPMILAVDRDDRPVGFMIADGDSIEALFVDPVVHGQGVGKALLTHAVEALGAKRLDVNEQNIGAQAFYRRMGFTEAGRSVLDGQGRPYPLIHMERRA